MTKKDYITIANALKPFYNDKDNVNCGNCGEHDDQYHDLTINIITAISKAMSKDNPKFNPIRFLDMIRGKDKQQ